MLIGSMFFLFGLRLFGQSSAFWPLTIFALVLLFSIFDGGNGIRNVFLGTWHGIPVILLILAGGGLAFWLEQRMTRSTYDELASEIEENEAAFTAANRPGGWKQYYGIGKAADAEAPQVIPDSIRRHGWRPRFSDAADRLADVAQAHRDEQQRLLRESENLRWMHGRGGRGDSGKQSG